MTTGLHLTDVVACRDMGNAELHAFMDVQRYEIADNDEVAAILARNRFQVARNELARRQRLYQAGRDVPNPRDTRYEAWRDVVRQVRTQGDIVHVFAESGYPLKRVGTSSRRQSDEHAGPCLLCGGDDRMRVWAGPNGRYWCRRCRVGGDIIAAAQTLLPACQEWHAAVSYLARSCGVATPEEPGVGRTVMPRMPIPGVRRRG